MFLLSLTNEKNVENRPCTASHWFNIKNQVESLNRMVFLNAYRSAYFFSEPSLSERSSLTRRLRLVPRPLEGGGAIFFATRSHVKKKQRSDVYALRYFFMVVYFRSPCSTSIDFLWPHRDRIYSNPSFPFDGLPKSMLP